MDQNYHFRIIEREREREREKREREREREERERGETQTDRQTGHENRWTFNVLPDHAWSYFSQRERNYKREK